MNFIITIILFLITPFSYFLGILINKKISWLHPFFSSSLILVSILLLTGLSQNKYIEASSPFVILSEMSVVSIGWLIYRDFKNFQGNKLAVVASIVTGSLMSLTSVWLIFSIFDAPKELFRTMCYQCSSGTTAISICAFSEGFPGLAALLSAICAVSGAFVGPFVIRRIGISNRLASILALETASRSFTTGIVEGTFSGISIGITSLVVSVLFPLCQ